MCFSKGLICELNIYDTKTVRCLKCDNCIGEIDFDARVIRSICGQCYDPTPDVRDQLSYRMKIPANKKIEPIALKH